MARLRATEVAESVNREPRPSGVGLAHGLADVNHRADHKLKPVSAAGAVYVPVFHLQGNALQNPRRALGGAADSLDVAISKADFAVRGSHHLNQTGELEIPRAPVADDKGNYLVVIAAQVSAGVVVERGADSSCQIHVFAEAARVSNRDIPGCRGGIRSLPALLEHGKSGLALGELEYQLAVVAGFAGHIPEQPDSEGAGRFCGIGRLLSHRQSYRHKTKNDCKS